jgi:hypothetical protein
MLGGSISDALLQLAIDAGDNFACGVAANALLGGSAISGAARQRLLALSEVGVRRGDLMSIVGVARDLARRGQKKEAATLLRKMDHVTVQARMFSAHHECLALREAGKMRAAMRAFRWMACRLVEWVDESRPYDDILFNSEREWVRAFTLAGLEKVTMY